MPPILVPRSRFAVYSPDAASCISREFVVFGTCPSAVINRLYELYGFSGAGTPTLPLASVIRLIARSLPPLRKISNPHPGLRKRASRFGLQDVQESLRSP